MLGTIKRPRGDKTLIIITDEVVDNGDRDESPYAQRSRTPPAVWAKRKEPGVSNRLHEDQPRTPYGRFHRPQYAAQAIAARPNSSVLPPDSGCVPGEPALVDIRHGDRAKQQFARLLQSRINSLIERHLNHWNGLVESQPRSVCLDPAILVRACTSAFPTPRPPRCEILLAATGTSVG